MNTIDHDILTDKEEKPLTRSDVEDLKDYTESPNKSVQLHYQNLKGVDLSNMSMVRANLNFGDLSHSNLINADFSYTTLVKTNLSHSNLTNAKLDYASLANANLSEAIMVGANLVGANLSYANLSYANLSYANLSYADLSYTDLTNTNLSNAILEGTVILHTALDEAILVPSNTKEKKPELLVIQLRIREEPLTAYNLAKIMSNLTSLYTKYWLIQQKRYGDLITYNQTLSSSFDKEANLIIGRMTHNSPALIDLITGNMPSIFDALKTTITLAQSSFQIKSAALDNETKKLDMTLKQKITSSDLADKKQSRKIEAQKAELEYQMKQLEIREKQLEIQEKQLEFEKKRVEIALDIASKATATVSSINDEAMRNMIVRTLLSNILQQMELKGLELINHAPPNT